VAKILGKLRKKWQEIVPFHTKKWKTRENTGRNFGFMNYKVKIRETRRPFLLQDELDRIINKQILTERLSQARDIFVFCWYTGLALCRCPEAEKARYCNRA
jgi:hypothetical protein